MPESRAVSELMGKMGSIGAINPDVAEKYSPARLTPAETDERAARNLRSISRKNVAYGENAQGEEVRLEQDPSRYDIDARLYDVFESHFNRSDATSREALGMWGKLESDATEKMGAPTVPDAVVAAENSIVKHNSVDARRDEIANRTIDALAADTTGGIYGAIKLDIEAFAKDAGFDVADGSRVSWDTLKRNPAFAEYRARLVVRVQELSQDVAPLKISSAENWKAGNRLNMVKNILNRVNLQGAVTPGAAKDQLFAQLANARILTSEESALLTLPKVSDAQEYLNTFGNFNNRAGFVIDNEQVLDAMHPIAIKAWEESAVADQSASDAVRDEAITTNNELMKKDEAKKALRADRLERVRSGREAQAEALLQSELAAAKERAARMELSDLEIQANNFAGVASEQAQVAELGLAALAELHYSTEKIGEFDAAIADHKLPAVLESIVKVEGGVNAIDQFIQSNGRKGDVEAVRRMYGNLAGLANLAKSQEGLPSSFLTLNTLQEGDQRMVETGISAGISEGGNIEYRLATRQNGKIEIKSTDPVLRFDVQNVHAAFNNISFQESSLSEARENVSTYERRMKLPTGTPEVKRQTKAKLEAAKKSVEAYTQSLARAKAELAAQLKTTATDKTVSGAFAEMADAQLAVAKEFYGQDFAAMVGEIAKETDLKPSEVTPEVLAALVVSARDSSAKASEMAEYFADVNEPERAITQIMADAEPWIMNLSYDHALMEEDIATMNNLNNPELRAAVSKKIEKQRRALQQQAKDLAVVLNEDSINRVPKAFRKGAKAIPMTKAEFKKSVSATLELAGFDASKYQKAPEGLAPSEKNYGRTVAEMTRAGLTYESDVQALVNNSLDALQTLDESAATNNLISALEGGDVEEFMSLVNTTRESGTTAELNTRAESRAQALKEMLTTPDAVLRAMARGESTWQEAVDAATNGTVDQAPVLRALAEATDPDGVTVRNEAARRFQMEMNETVRAAGTPDQWVDGRDPLAERPDLAERMQFLNTITRNQYASFWEPLIARANAEKKTAVAQG